MNKRTFLKNAATAFLAPLAGRLLAAPAAGKSRFLLVFLRGGYDAANVFIPVTNGFYYESRPNIAVARESVLPLTSEWGLHPALGDTVYRLYQNGQRSEEHTSELQSQSNLVCRLLLEKKKQQE